MVFIPQAQPHAQSLFLFPIVFGINYTFDPSELLLLALVGCRSHKNLDRGRHVGVKRRDFGGTRPLSVSAFPRVYCRTVPGPFKGATIEWTACMTRSTELDGDAENRLMLRFRRQQGRRAPKGWRELSSISEERGISTTFVGWLLCDFNREMCRKGTNNGD